MSEPGVMSWDCQVGCVGGQLLSQVTLLLCGPCNVAHH